MTLENQICILPKEVERPVIFTHALPEDGSVASFLLSSNSSLYETHCFKEPCSSWMTSNSILQDGSLILVTPFDVLFLILSIIEQQETNEFLNISEYLMARGHIQINQALQKDPSQLDCICDSNTDATQHRLSEDKVMLWLRLKVQNLIEHLKTVDNRDKLETYALNLMMPYLSKVRIVKLAKYYSVSERELGSLERKSQKKQPRKRQEVDVPISKKEAKKNRDQKKASRGTISLTAMNFLTVEEGEDKNSMEPKS